MTESLKELLDELKENDLSSLLDELDTLEDVLDELDSQRPIQADGRD